MFHFTLVIHGIYLICHAIVATVIVVTCNPFYPAATHTAAGVCGGCVCMSGWPSLSGSGVMFTIKFNPSIIIMCVKGQGPHRSILPESIFSAMSLKLSNDITIIVSIENIGEVKMHILWWAPMACVLVTFVLACS